MSDEDEAYAAIRLIHAAKEKGIFSATGILAVARRFDTCRTDLNDAGVHKDVIDRECDRYGRFKTGSKTHGDYSTVIIKPSVDRTEFQNSGADIYPLHRSFMTQTVLHEAGHLEYAQIQQEKMRQWADRAQLINPQLRNLLEDPKKNQAFAESATESFSDALGIMAQVSLGVLSKTDFTTLCDALHKDRSTDIGWSLSSARRAAAGFLDQQIHDTRSTVTIIKSIGFDVISATPPDRISDLALAATVQGLSEKFELSGALPRNPAHPESVALLPPTKAAFVVPPHSATSGSSMNLDGAINSKNLQQGTTLTERLTNLREASEANNSSAPQGTTINNSKRPPANR